MVVTDGKVLWEYGNTARIEAVASVRKSVLAMLYGNYVEQGIIDLNLTLAELGIDDVEGLLPIEKEATIEHLITARSGVYHPAATYGDNTAYAPERGTQVPGDYFLYNNWDFNVSGTIFETLTETSIFDAIESDLAIPLGFEQWERERHSRYGATGIENRSNFPGYPIYLSVRDMARLGQLMLQDGNWNGKQVIPAAWAKQIRSLVTPSSELNPPERREGIAGYGYMWWVIDDSKAECPLEQGYLARGGLGDYIFVLPQLELVIAIKTRETVWRYVTRSGTDGDDILGLVQVLVEAKIELPCV